MGYCTNAQVLKLLQTQSTEVTPPTVSFTAAQVLAENGYAVDTSSVTVTAQQILDENNYTTPSATIVEPLIDNTINFVNLQTNTNIAAMTGTAGSKTAIMTRTQADQVKSIVALRIKAYKDRGPQVGLSGLSVTSVISDPQYALFSENIKAGLLRLRALSITNMENLVDNAVSHINSLATANIPLMSGVAGGKIVYMTSHEAAAVKPFISVMLRSALQLPPDPQLDAAYKEASAKLTWNYMRGDYTQLISEAIRHASRTIDDFCLRPAGYFEAGGIITTEIYSGKDVIYSYVTSGASTVYPYGAYVSGTYNVLKLVQSPVLECIRLYENVNGVWTSRGVSHGFWRIPSVCGFAEGFYRASSTYYEVLEEGLHFKTAPAQNYNNLRITYLAGYRATPDAVSTVCVLLAVQVVQSVVANTMLLAKQLVLPEPVLSEQMQMRLRPYKRIVLPKLS